MGAIRVLSEAEVIGAFKDPRSLMRTDGSVDPAWERDILAVVHLPAPLPYADGHGTMVRTVRVHERLFPIFLDLFADLYKSGLWETIGAFGGCYCWRQQRRATKLSHHCWAIAIDMDVLDNPFMAVIPRVDARVKQVMARHGFVWGGATIWGGAFPWARRDPMHWEFADLSLIREVA